VVEIDGNFYLFEKHGKIFSQSSNRGCLLRKRRHHQQAVRAIGWRVLREFHASRENPTAVRRQSSSEATPANPLVSAAERKESRRSASAQDLIMRSPVRDFPRDAGLSQHAQAMRGRPAVVPPFYYKHRRLDGLTKYFSMLFDK